MGVPARISLSPGLRSSISAGGSVGSSYISPSRQRYLAAAKARAGHSASESSESGVSTVVLKACIGYFPYILVSAVVWH